MEELINRIITIEDLAKAITNEAYQNKKNMQREIDAEIEQYKKYLSEKEKKNLAEISDKAKLLAEEESATIGKKLQTAIDDIRLKYNSNKESWEEAVFQSIIQ